MAVTVPISCSSSSRSANIRLPNDQRTAVTALRAFAAACEKRFREVRKQDAPVQVQGLGRLGIRLGMPASACRL